MGTLEKCNFSLLHWELLLFFGFVPGVSENPLFILCCINTLLLRVVLCETFTEREDLCIELTLSSWSGLVCCYFE